MNEEQRQINMWGYATRGLFGVIRMLDEFEADDLPHSPSLDFVRAAMRLRDLAQRIEDKGLADNSLSFDRPK